MMDIGEVVKNNTSVGGEGVHKVHPENNGTPPTDFVLQWGSRKRPRCMKIQVKNDSTTERTRVLVSRAVVRTTRDSSTTATTTINNFRRPFSPPPPPPPLPSLRNPRNSETCSAMRGQANGAVASSVSPERVAEEKRGGNQNHNHSMNNGNGNVNGNGNGVGGGASAASSDSKKGATSSGSDPSPVWLPKFVLTLTNKEKEEDFMAIKGSKLPQRPKKRAKVIQRSLNLVSPGSWLCDLTLERYEVREKKISKKRPRGLKAMGNVDSDSE